MRSPIVAGGGEFQAGVSHPSLVERIRNELHLMTATTQGGADRERGEKVARRTKAARHDLHESFAHPRQQTTAEADRRLKCLPSVPRRLPSRTRRAS